MAAPPGQPTALKASVPQKGPKKAPKGPRKGYPGDMLLTADDTDGSQTFFFSCTEKISEDIVKIISLLAMIAFPLSNDLN